MFDTNAQTDAGRKNLSESVFAYLNRSATPGSAACRALMEDWMSHVPASEQQEFRSRFRSADNVQFGSAFQELFLYEFLRGQNCALDFHPPISGTSKRPDFIVCQPSTSNFVLEARTATEIASGPQSNPRGDRIRDFLRQMNLDGHKLGIDELTVGARDLPQRALRKHIADAIATGSGKPDGVVRYPPT